MDLIGSIPAPILIIGIIAFAWWYTFKRGGGSSPKELRRLRRQDEVYKRKLSIADKKARLEEIEQKARERRRKDSGTFG